MTNNEEMLWERSHEYNRASEQSDPALLERITVHDLRHHLTESDRHLEELAGQVEASEAGRGIRQRVSVRRAACSPEYAEECKRKMYTCPGEA